MSYSENWQSTTVGAVPAGWAGDTSLINVAATTINTSSHSLQSVNDAAVHLVYFSSGDTVGGDGTFVVNIKTALDGTGIFFFRITNSSPTAATITGYGLQLWGDASGGLIFNRFILGSGSSGGGGVVASVSNTGTGVPIADGIVYQATIVAKALVFTIQVQRLSDNQYLTSGGTWQSGAVNCISVTDSSGSGITGAGKFGFYEFVGTSAQANLGDISIAPLTVTATLGTTPLTVGGATSTATASGFTGSTVVWTSDNTGVATINSSTGVNTPVGAGTCRFTATGVANATQTATTATLTVNAASATAFTLTGPNTGTTGVASGNFTVTPTGGIETGVFTPNVISGVTYSPTTLSWSGANNAQTFTVTNAASATISVNGTFSNSLTPPSSVSYTTSPSVASAFTLTGPSTGVVGVASTSFTVTPNGTETGVFTPGAVAGVVYSPTTLTWTSSTSAQTFTATSSTAGAKSINGTFSNSLTPPSSVTWTVAAQTVTLSSSTTVLNLTASVTETVTPNAPINGTVTLTPGGSAATGLTSQALTFSNSSTPQTVVFTPTVVGTLTITETTNTGATIAGSPQTITVTNTTAVIGVYHMGPGYAGSNGWSGTCTITDVTTGSSVPVSTGNAIYEGLAGSGDWYCKASLVAGDTYNFSFIMTNSVVTSSFGVDVTAPLPSNAAPSVQAIRAEIDSNSTQLAALRTGVIVTTNSDKTGYTFNLAQVGLTPRDLGSVADSSLTVGDAFVCAIVAGAGKKGPISGTSMPVKTPSTGTVIKTYVLDTATAAAAAGTSAT